MSLFLIGLTALVAILTTGAIHDYLRQRRRNQ